MLENNLSPAFNLENYDPNKTKSCLSNAFVQRYRVLPLHQEHMTLHLGMSNPHDHTIIDVIRFHTGMHIKPHYVDATQLNKLIETYFHQDYLSQQLESALAKLANETTTSTDDTQYDEPVAHFVNQLLQNAVDEHISDIHIEPFAHYCRIRFRRDGKLFEATRIPTHLATRVVMRLKIISYLNIAEKRQPQDGHITYQAHQNIDIRINTCPTLFGEKIVLRLLNVTQMQLHFDQLGLSFQQIDILTNMIQKPHGLILVTGATGSGKTITLYSILNALNQVEKNIATIEDPIEIELAGINQVNIAPKIGLDFAAILRAFLRQDPDILMIGEIRDQTTAEIAIQAAQTGHLVLSSLHTNTAIESLNRLLSLNVARQQLGHALNLIIAQKLVRILCIHCKQKVLHPILNVDFIYEAKGCSACFQGYKGRTAIFELIPISQAIIKLMVENAPIDSLYNQIKKEGVVSLLEAGLQKVADGITSLDELKGVLGHLSMSNVLF